MDWCGPRSETQSPSRTTRQALHRVSIRDWCQLGSSARSKSGRYTRGGKAALRATGSRDETVPPGWGLCTGTLSRGETGRRALPRPFGQVRRNQVSWSAFMTPKTRAPARKRTTPQQYSARISGSPIESGADATRIVPRWIGAPSRSRWIGPAPADLRADGVAEGGEERLRDEVGGVILGLEHSLQGRHGVRASRSRFEHMFDLCDRLGKAMVVAREQVKLGKCRCLIILLEVGLDKHQHGCGAYELFVAGERLPRLRQFIGAVAHLQQAKRSPHPYREQFAACVAPFARDVSAIQSRRRLFFGGGQVLLCARPILIEHREVG